MHLVREPPRLSTLVTRSVAMKRAAVGLSVVSIVGLCGWYAIAVAQRSEEPRPVGGPSPVGQSLATAPVPASAPLVPTNDPFSAMTSNRNSARLAEPKPLPNPYPVQPLPASTSAEPVAATPRVNAASRYVTVDDEPAILTQATQAGPDYVSQAGPTLAPPSTPAPSPFPTDDRYGMRASSPITPGNADLPPAGEAAFAGDTLPTPAPLPGASLSTPQPLAPSSSPLTPVTPSAIAPSSSTTSFTPAAAPAAEASSAQGTGRPGAKTLEGAQAPSLIVEKFAPAEIQVGKPAKFSIVVRNVGTIAAADVEVLDEVPSGTTLLSTSPRAERGPRGELRWNLGTLKPNDETTVHVELMPVAEGEIGSVANVRFAVSSSARTICTRPELVLDVSAPREVLIGENVAFTIRVTNPGTGIATGVLLSEQVPAALEHPAGAELEYEVGDLRPGETRELELIMKAVKAGQIVNRLTAKADAQLQVSKESALAVIAPALDLVLEGPRRRFLERQAVYTVSVTNPGTAAARNVALITQLPPGLEFVEANNAGQYDPRTRSVHWLLDELPPREVGKVTLTTMPTEAGDLPLKIASSAERGLNVEKQEMIRVEGVAALVFQVVDRNDPVEVGGEVVYDIQVSNQGSKAAENVQLQAILPPEMKPLAAEGASRYDVAGQQVSFQPLARLAPRSEATFQVRAQALRAGDAKISVQIKSSDMTTPVVKEEATRIFADQ